MFKNKLFVSGDENVQVPSHLHFGKFLLDHIRHFNKEIALENASTGDKITYRELTQYAVNLSVFLTELGVGRGDVVGIGSEKRVTYMPTTIGIVLTGAAYTPFDLETVNASLKHKVGLSKPKLFICSQLFWKTYGEILKSFEFIKTYVFLDKSQYSELWIEKLISKEVNVEAFEPASVVGQTDTALVLYSSGTTGMSKGVELSHLNCIIHSSSKDFEDESLKTIFIYAEWYHSYDTFTIYKCLCLGRKIIFVDPFTPQAFLKSVQGYQVNVAMIVPSLVGYLSKAEDLEKHDLSSLKIIYSSASPVHDKTFDVIRKRFVHLKSCVQGYGMTETGIITYSWGTKGPKIGSVGIVSPGITLKIVHPETREVLGANQRGEICLRGPVLMKGYIGIDPSTYLDEEGFFKTGDLGYYDEDKYIYIVDRLKEIISYNGYKIAPLEFETVLSLHPGVREAGVVGRPVVDFDEEPTAFVVRQPGVEVTEQELKDYVDSELPHYMKLRGGVLFIEKLPRNSRGKILRNKLREMLN